MICYAQIPGEYLTDPRNRFLFNGKENASPAPDKLMLDYGARQYDPALARWTTPDPLADMYTSHSPYCYCFNNPVAFTDPNGMRPWPVNPKYKNYNRTLGDGFRTISRPRHNGVDINYYGAGNNDLGAPIIATHSGLISRLAHYTDGNGGGNRISITSPDGTVQTNYMHLDSFAVSAGQYVNEGDVIGYMGGSGKGIKNEYGVHLHYEIMVNGKHINPQLSSTELVDPNSYMKSANPGGSYIKSTGPGDGVAIDTVIVYGKDGGIDIDDYFRKNNMHELMSPAEFKLYSLLNNSNINVYHANTAQEYLHILQNILSLKS